MFAKYAGIEQRTSGRCVLVCSLEQDLETKQRIDASLAALGLARHVTTIHAPLTDEHWYSRRDAEISDALGGNQADLLLVDGPYASEGARLPAIRELGPLCRPGARWFLHDAFRDPELRILKEWESDPRCTVEGIYPVCMGLAKGTINGIR